jgi:hypothetical protein
LVQAALSGHAVVFHSLPSKQLVYPLVAWSQRQFASEDCYEYSDVWCYVMVGIPMTISPLTLEQLVPPVPVQRCQVILGWVSLCSLPITHPEAWEAQKAIKAAISIFPNIEATSNCLRRDECVTLWLSVFDVAYMLSLLVSSILA